MVAVLFVLCTGRTMSADPWPADAPPVPEKVRQLMQDRNYAEAVKAIDEAAARQSGARRLSGSISRAGPAPATGQYDKAIATFDTMQKEFPKSDWLRRARFAKAVTLARKGDFRAAELIYRAEAEYLLSADRKQQIADIYLEFADSLFKPPKDTSRSPTTPRPWSSTARRWRLGRSRRSRSKSKCWPAQCLAALGEVGRGGRGSTRSSSRTIRGMPLAVEARFRLGECRLAEGDRKQARRVWQDLIAGQVGNLSHKHGGAKSDHIADAQFQLCSHLEHSQAPERRRIEPRRGRAAGFLGAVSRTTSWPAALTWRSPKALSHGAGTKTPWPRWGNSWPIAAIGDCEEIPAAQNLLGRCYQLQKKYPEAIRRLARVSGEASGPQAVERRAAPDHRHRVSDGRRQAGGQAIRRGQPAVCANSWRSIRWTPRLPGILLSMSDKPYAEGKWDEAIANWRRLVSKYPDSPEASLAQFSIAGTLEWKLGKLDEALEEYRKVPGGPAAGEALQAIARLTAKTMTVATQRVFRSDETPRLKLVTRNIESVTVRAYNVDLETYFRKMHLAQGVEGLDIALIDPDQTFEFKVPSYAKHRQVENRIDVPLPARPTDGRDGRHRQQQDSGGHHAGDPQRPGRDREEFARRGVRVRREHAHRQALAGRAAADFQRPAGFRRGRDRPRRRVPEVVQGTEAGRRRARVRRGRRQRGHATW